MRASPVTRGLWSFGMVVVAGSALAQLPPPASAPAASAAPAAPASSSSLSAGGLAPPPALETSPAPGAGAATPAATEAELAKADKEDSGRGLEFVWLNGEVGVMHLGLGTFSNDKIVDPTSMDTTQTGVVVGAGAGVRLVFLTLGARFRYAPLPDATLWTLGLEAGLHAPFGAFEPYATLGVGYVSVGPLPDPDDPKLQGVDARLGGGLDVYLTNMFSVGANVGADLLFLSREHNCTIPLKQGATGFYCQSGSSTGGALTATAVAGLHF
jgi:hypothetical protein